MEEEKNRNEIRSRFVRITLAIITIGWLALAVVLKMPISALLFFLLIFLMLPAPLILFGRWPPDGHVDAPFDYLSWYEKLECIWASLSIYLLVLAIAVFVFNRWFHG